MSDPLEARDVTTLCAAVAAGAAPPYLMFWGHTPSSTSPVGPWILSQWFEAPFEVEGRRYRTAEHWMMAGKARLFGDQEHHDAILDTDSPRRAKDLGRRVRGYDHETWVARRYGLVVTGNVHKFSTHPELGAYLQGTAEQVLVEASPADLVWGIGLAQDHADATDPARWRGTNLLGFALMEARARLLSPR